MQTMKIMLGVAIAVSILAAALPVRAQEAAAVQRHIDAARELAGTRYQRAMTRLCLPCNGRPRPEFPKSVAPLRVFDNLYFVGLPDVYSWALDTPEGIILFDSLNNAGDAETTIVGGMKQLGLDPRRASATWC
jgi:metallo-beta-lactamase class B